MIQITRSQAREFRAVVRKAGIGKPITGLGPSVCIASSNDGVRLRSNSHAAAVEYVANGQYADDEFAIPLEALADCEGRSDDPVVFDRQGNEQVVLRWTDKRLPRVAVYSVEPVKPIPTFPVRPETLVENDPDLWYALRDAASAAAVDRARFAIDCIQIWGQSRKIIATDGRQALIQEGFNFPWPGGVLIPALKVLGCLELVTSWPISIGRSEDWLAIVRGPWTIWLRIETDGRFPDVESIVPQTKPDTPRLQLDPEDAEFLLTALPKASQKGADPILATIELNGKVTVRTKEGEHSKATELVLSNSRPVGEPITCTTNVDILRRAAHLGFREIRLFGPESRALCDDGRRKLVWVLLDKDAAIAPSADAVRIESPSARSETIPIPPTSRRFPKMSETTSVPIATTQTPQTEPLTEAQPVKRPRRRGSAIEQTIALREALKDAVVQTNEVIRALKAQKREARIVQTTLESLKQLQKVAS